jgi:hypothetical protein
MRRVAAAVLIAIGIAASACSGGGTAQPTPRPSGHRGTLLNPIDRTKSTVDQLNNQQQQQEQQTGSGYP